jgi:membrane protease YdiL (CAAX protease family)
MVVKQFSRTTLVAVIVATVAALIVRSWLQLQLIGDGMNSAIAGDVSYLVVPLILVILLFPLWSTERAFLSAQFRRKDVTLTLVLAAIAIGVLVRLCWWAHLIAGVSLGVYQSDDPAALVGPTFSFQCDSPAIVALGFLALAVLTPVIEEIVHRAYILTALRRRGFLLAILVSALIFAVFHRQSSWAFALFAGIIFGVQYWTTKSLWASIISHATVNAVSLIDWRCLRGSWNPPADDIPLLIPATTALIILAGLTVAIVVLLRKNATGAKCSPR